jgi:hypothetical protein
VAIEMQFIAGQEELEQKVSGVGCQVSEKDRHPEPET